MRGAAQVPQSSALPRPWAKCFTRMNSYLPQQPYEIDASVIPISWMGKSRQTEGKGSYPSIKDDSKMQSAVNHSH